MLEGGKDLTLDVFDDAVNEVVNMLARDKLPRFLNIDAIKERKDLYERCVKISSRVDALEAKEAQSKVSKSASKERKSPRKTLKREEDRSNLSGLIEEAMLGNVTRLFASQVGLLQPYDSNMFKVLRSFKGDEKKFKR